MPPPEGLDAATGTSHALPSAASISSTSVLTFRLHPFVVVNFFNHHTRVKDQAARCGDSSSSSGTTEDVRRRELLRPPRMFGCVIGVQRGQTVEIFNSFDLLLDPVSGTLDHALLEKKQELYKKVFPDFDILGWYSTGSAVQDTDMQIHKALMDANGRAFYLLLNPAINLFQRDLPVTIYESVLDATDGSPQLIFVKSNCTIETVEAERISVDHGAGLKPCSLGSNRATSDVNALPLENGKDARCKRRRAFWTMLLETPSGFAMFGVAERLLRYPEEIWAWFTHLSDAHDVIFTLGFIKVDNKSVAWDSDVGPGEDLGKFILKFPITKALIVPDAQLKFVIEKKLNVDCWFNAHIVHELTWGLKYVLDDFVPEEKDNLTNECYLPLSKLLEKKIKAYGFSVSPRMIDREFINAVGYLNYLEVTSESLSRFLHHKFGRCFPGSSMSNLEFAKAIADSLHSSEEMVPKDDECSKQDMLRFADFLLAAPELKNRAISHLKRMEVAASEDPLVVPEQKNSCLKGIEAAASESDLQETALKLGGVGLVKQHPWVTIFSLGCGIIIGMLHRRKV